HYPLLKKVIAEVMGSDIGLIDSAVETAKRTAGTLKKDGMERKLKEKPLREFYVTDSPERFVKVGERFLQQKIERIEKIEL
ncbi:MAG: glutamate racemase, partial [Thermodesulfovibrionales bacterium]|nr:glutamate racemase [Thermodesulfovibrionales bacterium]